MVRATLRLGNKVARFEVLILLRRSEDESVFSLKLAEYIKNILELKYLNIITFNILQNEQYSIWILHPIIPKLNILQQGLGLLHVGVSKMVLWLLQQV